MWLTINNLLKCYEKFVNNPDNEQIFDEFYNKISSNLDLLQAPLQNKPRNSIGRMAIKKIGEEIHLPSSFNGKISLRLDQKLSDEAVEISDLFEVDEMDALDFLLTGESCSYHFCSESRFYAGILCYYDSHRSILELLKSILLLQRYINTNGQNFVKLRETIASIATSKMVGNLLDRFALFAPENQLKQIAHLSELMSPHYQEMVHSIIVEIQSNCYDALCLCILYGPDALMYELVEKLFNLLAIQPPIPEAFANLSHITTLTLLLLFVNPVRLKHFLDGSIEVFNHFNERLSEEKRWASNFVKATLQLGFGVSIKFARSSLGLPVPHEIDEYKFIEAGIQGMALEFLQAYIIKHSAFKNLTFTIGVLDSMIKNLICYFPEKITEMFNLCEEELYSLMEVPSKSTIVNGQPTAPQISVNYNYLQFKSLLELITVVYEGDAPKLAECRKEFTDPKFEGLYDFILSGKAISAPTLTISYLNMLRSLCRTKESGNMFFNMLKQ